MNFTQNEKISQVAETTLVIGVDIASETHYARAFDFRGREVGKVFKFDTHAEGFKSFTQWINALCIKENKTDVIVGAEPTGHYWFTFGEYLKNNKTKLVFVNPMHVKRSKEFDDNHPSKTDNKDPKTIAKLVIEGRFLEPYIPADIYAELRVMNENRMRITKELNGIKNRVERWLKIYFPEYKKVFSDWSCESSLIMLLNAPMPKDVIELKAEGINQQWRNKKIRAVGIKRASELYNTSLISVGVTEGEQSARYEMKMLLEDYQRKHEQLMQVLIILEELCMQIPHVEKLMAIKGVGLLTVASFVAEVGDISRFKSPKQIQKLAGLAITENSSGKHKGKTGISKRGRKRLRHAMFQVILPLIRNNEEFKELHKYFTQREKNPLKKKQSVIALSCKLIRIFFVIMKKGVKYSSEKLVADIVREETKKVA